MLPRCCLIIAVVLAGPTAAFAQGKAKKPNVLIVITDDQGHGDLGFHGNPVIKTPHLDKFAKSAVRMKNFYVSPVCSPTRSSLMTGRYNYRTGIVDTFQGRSMMHPDEITIAAILKALGYRTGIFGKWHLGDCYPLRPIDHGFDEELILKGGGIGQPSDPPGGESYFNPILQQGGKSVRKEGYCTDVFTDAALDFIGKNKAGPFFCYLAFNCPHGPLEVPKKYYDMYKGKTGLDQFPKLGFPIGKGYDADVTAKIYGMVTNIDDNFARLIAKLDELGIADDTIVIFLTDNGPQQPRYNSGMRGLKASVFEGGTRVPFFVRWPGGFKGDRSVVEIAAHIDIAPTVVSACGGAMPKDRTIDGKNLLPLWRSSSPLPPGEGPGVRDWPDRSLFFQWHRGDVPEMYRAFAVRTQEWRLVQPNGVAEGSKFDKTKLMLFNIKDDPNETKDVANQNETVVADLKKKYESWFKDVESTRKFAPPRIVVGSDKEPVTVLTRQDMRVTPGAKPGAAGHWLLSAEEPGRFDVTITLQAAAGKDAKLRVEVPNQKFDVELREGQKDMLLKKVALPAGPIRLDAEFIQGGTSRAVRFVEIRRAK